MGDGGATVGDKLAIDQWFSAGGDFCPLNDIANIWRHFWLSQLGRGEATGTLVGGGQECRETYYNI